MLAMDQHQCLDRDPDTDIEIIDDLVPLDLRSEISDFLREPGWVYGWKSDPDKDKYSFWHKHFAGHERPDHTKPDEQYNCESELHYSAILKLWNLLKEGPLTGHTLLRCYANGYPYGADGSVHTDTVSENGYTVIYYPHRFYDLNWAGETIFFNEDLSDIKLAVCPKPGRVVIFKGIIPHVGRGVSRSCPHMRVTLMFKTETSDDRQPVDRLVEFLRSLGADKINHSGRTLLAHLIGTRNLLRKWGASVNVQNAGLFHSIYGTVSFKHALKSVADRDEIKNLIGEEAESLVYIFCTTSRKFETIALPYQQMYNLMQIEAANLADQGICPLEAGGYFVNHRDYGKL
jgi:SM-20-related protein